MKFMLVFTAFLFTTLILNRSAVAGLSKGDFVRYKVTEITAGKTQLMEHKIEVTDLNPSQGNFTTKLTITRSGSVLSETLETQDLNSASEAESTVDQCSLLPSEIASLETIQVTAGTFKVCHLKSEPEGSKLDQYMGKVLFGMVKSVFQNPSSNTLTTTELVEVKRK